MNSFIEELRWRGMLQDMTPEIEEHLQKGMSSAYLGFDPTADSLHIGHLVGVMTLLHFQRAGHKPFALVGGATGMIGDPSFKSTERNLLDKPTLDHNVACIQAQLSKFLDFSGENLNKARLVNNYDWMSNFSFLEFIRDVGKHITVNYMMSKDSVKRRLEDGNGLSFTEFSYQLIQGYDSKNIKLGNTLSNDLLPFERFDYCLANPPFGVDWKKVQTEVTNEHRVKAADGRFGAGLPRVNDGSMLFLMHLLAKRKPVYEGGSRMGIVLSGSPLFNGGAGSGESEIRRWILENDWLEAIVALPNDMFYNTGIGTYIWILTNHKASERKGLVQLIDATNIHTPMRKSLGSKRKQLSQEQIDAIARIHDAFEESDVSKIFNTTDFGYRRITVERPLRLRFSVTAEKLATYNDTKGAEQAEKFAREFKALVARTSRD
jgi:hypothetical protein